MKQIDVNAVVKICHDRADHVQSCGGKIDTQKLIESINRINFDPDLAAAMEHIQRDARLREAMVIRDLVTGHDCWKKCPEHTEAV